MQVLTSRLKYVFVLSQHAGFKVRIRLVPAIGQDISNDRWRPLRYSAHCDYKTDTLLVYVACTQVSMNQKHARPLDSSLISSAGKFKYDPLRSKHKTIRVLSIQAGCGSAIRCTLVEQSLNGTHTCLSYTWGTRMAIARVYVNEKPFMIRENLSRFLRTARQYLRYGPFWIDALCINQDDNTERASK